MLKKDMEETDGIQDKNPKLEGSLHSLTGA